MFAIGATTACGNAAEISANNQASSGTGQSKSTNADNKQTENKSVENKNSAETAETKLVEIYDGRLSGETKKVELPKAESDAVQAEVKAKETVIKDKIKSSCEKDNFSAGSSIKGSFTKPNSSQNAYFYSLCDDGSATSPSGIGGIIIFEADKIVAHYAYNYIGSEDAVSLPDINKNGLSEIGLITEDGGQGLRGSDLMILEYKEGDLLKFIGSTQVGSVSFNSTSSSETADKISVEQAANPTFFRETYIKKDGAKDWSLSKKSEKFTLTPEGKSSTAFIKVN